MELDLIKEFVDTKHFDSLNNFLEENDEQKLEKFSVDLSELLGDSDEFNQVVKNADDAEEKLVNSFHNNLALLIQKTWVEETDEELKAQVLFQINEMCDSMRNHDYLSIYKSYFEILDTVVYLMFGNQTKSDDFCEYALRIDPEFGIFWWYLKSLPNEVQWTNAKARIAILLGMFFLANY